MLIIYQDDVLRKSIDLIKENVFTLKKTRSRRYLAKTITDAVYTDDLALLVNIPASAEQTARSIGLYVNANKTDSMRFKQEGTIFTLSGKALKLVDQFAYLGSNISSS